METFRTAMKPKKFLFLFLAMWFTDHATRNQQRVKAGDSGLLTPKFVIFFYIIAAIIIHEVNIIAAIIIDEVLVRFCVRYSLDNIYCQYMLLSRLRKSCKIKTMKSFPYQLTQF